MSNELLGSKVVVYEEEPEVRTIRPAATSVVGAVGIAERGPIGVPVWVTEETFPSVFGGFTPDSDLALALRRGFFKNAKAGLWVVRTCHYTDPSDPATATAMRSSGYLTVQGVPSPAEVVGTAAAPFELQPGAVLALNEGGNPEDVVEFQAVAAKVVAGSAGPYALADGQTLTVVIDSGTEQVLTFNAADFADIGNATVAEVLQAINAQLWGGKALDEVGSPAIASDTEGTASSVQITGGTAVPVFAFPLVAIFGTGNVARIRSVSVAEVKTSVESQIPDVVVETRPGGALGIHTVATGAGVSLQIGPSTAAAFGLDNDLHQGSDEGVVNALLVEGKDPGAHADQIEVEVKPSTSGVTGFFNLAVIEDGVDRKGFVNVCMDATHERHVEKVVNDPKSGSTLIRVVDLLVPGTPVPDLQTVQLTGGDNGLTGLDDNDFVGAKTGKTGLYALNTVLDLSVLCVPGRATPIVHNAMVQYCDVERNGLVFPVLDPPRGLSHDEVIDYFKNVSGLQNLSEGGAFQWCWPEVGNPAKSVFGNDETVAVPPSGAVCGVYVRNDGAKPGGVYTPPGGVENGRLFGVVGVENEEVLEETVRDKIYPERINPISKEPGTPFFIDGTRTLKGDGQFPYIHQKRGVIFIRRSLKNGLIFARHRTNNERLQREVFRTIRSFLRIQKENEGIVAFRIEISSDTSRLLRGQVKVLMPEATDWVVIGISQDPDLLGEELAA